MKWIKSWSYLEDQKLYLVMARHTPPCGAVRLYNPQLLKGWVAKRLMEGVYVATEFIAPKTMEECE